MKESIIDSEAKFLASDLYKCGESFTAEDFQQTVFGRQTITHGALWHLIYRLERAGIIEGAPACGRKGIGAASRGRPVRRFRKTKPSFNFISTGIRSMTNDELGVSPDWRPL